MRTIQGMSLLSNFILKLSVIHYFSVDIAMYQLFNIEKVRGRINLRKRVYFHDKSCNSSKKCVGECSSNLTYKSKIPQKGSAYQRSFTVSGHRAVQLNCAFNK